MKKKCNHEYWRVIGRSLTTELKDGREVKIGEGQIILQCICCGKTITHEGDVEE